MRETKDAIYFWNGYCSQWHPSPFIIEDREYNCAEQYMMLCKAVTFADFDAAAEIMQAKSPSKQKAIGRRVKNFDPIKWNEVCRLVVYRGNLAKFTQNKDLLAWLLETGDKMIVEASPEDKIWGIGLHFDDPRCEDVSKWEGTNWLGEAIMQVRSDIRQLGKV